MKIIDFTNCEKGYKGYDGADKKIPRVHDGIHYMIKFPSRKKSNMGGELIASYFNNPYSEYIGSSIFASAGIDAQRTLLGTFDDKVVVACEDFLLYQENSGFQLQEFSMLQNSFFESDEIGRHPKLEHIEEIFRKHERLAGFQEKAENHFWDIFIIDTLIANFDRHAGNWGYLVNIKTGEIKNAPVYDCGASLFARLDEDKLEEVMNDPQGMHERVFRYPLSAIQSNNRKINYHDFITGLEHKKCNAALARIFPRIDLERICTIIDMTPMISDKRKCFYREIITARYSNILQKAFEGLKTLEASNSFSRHATTTSAGESAIYTPAPRCVEPPDEETRATDDEAER
jgi:hypothetical protein